MRFRCSRARRRGAGFFRLVPCLPDRRAASPFTHHTDRVYLECAKNRSSFYPEKNVYFHFFFFLPNLFHSAMRMFARTASHTADRYNGPGVRLAVATAVGILRALGTIPTSALTLSSNFVHQCALIISQARRRAGTLFIRGILSSPSRRN